MPEIIPYESWEPLQTQIKKMEMRARNLEKYDRQHTVPPFEEIADYREELEKFTEIMNETRLKCEALGELISHDLVNYMAPLVLTTCYIYKLKETAQAWEKIRQKLFINRIMENVVEAVRFYVDEKLEMEKISMKNFMQEQVKVLEQAFYGVEKEQGKKHKLRIIAADDFSCQANRGTLANLLQNICQNARLRGGAIKLIITTDRKMKRGRIIVTDNGRGMDPLPGRENQENLIDDIFQPQGPRVTGKGLGLALAKDKMKLMNGDIACYGHGGIYNPGLNCRGAKFEIVFFNVEMVPT